MVNSVEAGRHTPMKYCLECGFVSEPVKYKPGTFPLEVALWVLFLIPVVFYSLNYKLKTLPMESPLWLLFFVPGILYSIWRLTTRYEGCAKCHGRRIVPTDSPVAKAAINKLSPMPSSQAWYCEKCGEPIFGGGRVCPSCGAAASGVSTGKTA